MAKVVKTEKVPSLREKSRGRRQEKRENRLFFSLGDTEGWLENLAHAGKLICLWATPSFSAFLVLPRCPAIWMLPTPQREDSYSFHPNFFMPQLPLSKTLETPLLRALVVLDKLMLKIDCPSHRPEDEWPCYLSSSGFLRKACQSLIAEWA